MSKITYIRSDSGQLVDVQHEPLDAVVPDGITVIGDHAFDGVRDILSSVTMPDSLERIEIAAFVSFPKLTHVELGNNLKYIGEDAFNSCGLIEVSIPDSVTATGVNVFSNCYALKSVRLSHNLRKISRNMFRHCIQLEKIVIPDSVQVVDEAAFQDCRSLDHIVLGKNVTSIETWAFYGCENLAQIELPDSLVSIGHAAFAGCEALESLVIPAGVNWVHPGAFSRCYALKQLVLKRKFKADVIRSWDLPETCAIVYEKENNNEKETNNE